MILAFRHAGLERLFQTGDRRRLSPGQVERIERILARLDEATVPSDMNLPGFGLHPLKGDRSGYWAVRVSGNWRIVFRFKDGHAGDVDLIDYH
ncbi:MAG: type II toxin-antitoxin system RelE/ParE family toxin [Bryobacterales bacterium]|nr:type II toxin-antitoxin system RelE/ParE family toxin [Bryobacterales bacterium]